MCLDSQEMVNLEATIQQQRWLHTKYWKLATKISIPNQLILMEERFQEEC